MPELRAAAPARHRLRLRPLTTDPTTTPPREDPAPMPTATAPAEEAPAVAITRFTVEHGVRYEFDEVTVTDAGRAPVAAALYGGEHVTRIHTHHPDGTRTSGPWTAAA